MVFAVGFLLGLMVGVSLIWLAARYWSEPQPLFQRLLRQERYAARTDVRLLLNELYQKAEEGLELGRKLEKRLVRLEDHLHQGMFAGEQDRRRAVYHLRREGLTPPEIARSLGIGLGEVELILSLSDQ